jgi:hypothetical protein
MKNIFLTVALTAGIMASAQVKIGDNVTTMNANSLLELESTNKGVLFPRVALTSTTSFAPLSAHVEGMTVYNTATASDVKPGLYSNNGTQWLRLVADSATALNVTAEQTGSYTALATDEIILFNNSTTSGITLTFPTSGIPVGKRYYVSNMGTADVFINEASPLREGFTVIPALGSFIYMYIGNGSWSVISGY